MIRNETCKLITICYNEIVTFCLVECSHLRILYWLRIKAALVERPLWRCLTETSVGASPQGKLSHENIMNMKKYYVASLSF